MLEWYEGWKPCNTQHLGAAGLRKSLQSQSDRHQTPHRIILMADIEIGLQEGKGTSQAPLTQHPRYIGQYRVGVFWHV